MGSSSIRPLADFAAAWQWTRQRAVAVATLVVALLLVGVVIWHWRQALSWWTVVWWLFALTAVRASRPEFAAAAVAPAAWLQPAAGVPLVGLAVLTSCVLGPRPFWIEPAGKETIDQVVQRLTTGMPALAAVLAGGLAWKHFAADGEWLPALVSATAAAAVVLRGLEIVAGRNPVLHFGELFHTAWWLAGWLWGAVLVASSQTHAVWVAAGLAAMLAVRREGAWIGSVAGDAIRRTSDVPGWVEQVYALALKATHCAWFELRLAINGSTERWSAGPDQQLAPGPANPPSRPPVRFGIHRRPSWVSQRQELPVDDGELEILIWRDPRQPVDAALEEQLDEVLRIVATGRFDSAVANLPGGELVDRQRVLELLNGAFASARESGTPLAIALVGLDHPREIREVHGTETCEQAMTLVSGAFAELLGASDAVCRYGGEEFLTLFLGRSGKQAVEVGEAIREAVAGLSLTADEESVPITVSVGVAAHPEVYVERPSELIPLADSALYEARRRGGNGLLLATGRGRFQDSAGETIEGSAESKEIAAPRLFV